MAKYHIPDRYVKGFVEISQLSTEQVDAIVSQFNNTSFGFDSSQITEELHQNYLFVEVEKRIIKSIVKTVYSVLSFEDSTEQEMNVAIKDLVDSLSSSFEDSNTTVNLDQLKAYINRLFDIKGSPKQTLKGRQLLGDNQKNLVSSKLVTDIRIVFDNNLDNSTAKNAVIVHNLRLTYFEDDEAKDLYLSLDSNDILDLEFSLKRAKQKESIIRNQFSNDTFDFMTLPKKE